MKNTIQRIKEYIDYKGVSIRAFEQSVGMSNGSFASQLKNNKTIGVDKLENILRVYCDVDTEWLLTGKGEMLKSEPEATTPYIYKDASPPMGAPPPEQQPTANSELIEKICQLSAENALLRRDVEVLRHENEGWQSEKESLQHEIEDLKNNRPKPASVPYDFDRPPAPSLVAEPEEAEYK